MPTQRLMLDGFSYESISFEDTIDLDKFFPEEGVWNALNDLWKEKGCGSWL